MFLNNQTIQSFCFKIIIDYIVLRLFKLNLQSNVTKTRHLKAFCNQFHNIKRTFYIVLYFFHIFASSKQ